MALRSGNLPSLLTVPAIPPSPIQQGLVSSQCAKLWPYQSSGYSVFAYSFFIAPALGAFYVPLKHTGRSAPSSGTSQASPLLATKGVTPAWQGSPGLCG